MTAHARLASDVPPLPASHRPSCLWESFMLDRSSHSRSAAGSAVKDCGMAQKILVVDDLEDNRRILRDLLSSASFETLEAETGEGGVALAEEQRPNLILMDLRLPGLDGYEATRRIKANPALCRIPVIAVTSYGLTGEEDRAREAGCDGYVAKPFSLRALLATVREHLG